MNSSSASDIPEGALAGGDSDETGGNSVNSKGDKSDKADHNSTTLALAEQLEIPRIIESHRLEDPELENRFNQRITSHNWRNSRDCKGHSKRFEHILKSGFWSDVVFKVGVDKQPVKAHKLILSTGSIVFETLFEEDMNVSEFDVADLEPLEFNLLLKFLYTGESPTKVEECLPVMNAATKYDIPDLVEYCGTLLIQTLTENSAIKIFKHSTKYGSIALKEAALQCISSNAFKLVESKEFQDLSEQELIEILKQDDLEVKNETQLFEAVMNWGRAELKRQKMIETPKYLRSVLEKVIYHVRFPQMDQADFSLKVYRSQILLDSDIIAVLMYFSLPVNNRGTAPSGPFNSKPRTPYTPRGKEFILQRLRQSETEVMDLATNKSTSKTYIPSTFQKHSIRFKADTAIWVKSFGINSMYQEQPDIESFNESDYECPICNNNYSSTPGLPCAQCSVNSSDLISVMIQLKTIENKVLASKNETLNPDLCESADKLYHVEFATPVFVRPEEWYIATFSISSGDFFGNQYTSLPEIGTHINFDLGGDGNSSKKMISFEFENDGNPRYTGTSQGYIPEIAFTIE